MTAVATPGFEGWAIVEQMGHKTIAGFVREVQLAGVAMLRIDVPGPEGTAEPIASQFIHASTLYALTPTAEAIVRKMAARTNVTPAAAWGVSALPAGRDEDDLVDDDQDDDEDADDEKDPRRVVDELLLEHGLNGVLEVLSQNYVEVPDPESDRYCAILEEAQRLVDTPGAWPERVAQEPPSPPVLVPGDALEGEGQQG